MDKDEFRYVLANAHWIKGLEREQQLKANGCWLRLHPTGDGFQMVRFFDNGYGMSLCRCNFTYGCDSGLMELAVLRGTIDDEWKLDYSTPITDDVIGYLGIDEAYDLMQKIEQLPSFNHVPLVNENWEKL